MRMHSAHFICAFIEWWRKRDMNVKKIYYLSERIYEPSKCGEEPAEVRKEYWRNLLGETMFNQMYRENIQFYGYVNGKEYAVRNNVKSKKHFIEFYNNIICLEQNLQIEKKLDKSIEFSRFYGPFLQYGKELFVKKIGKNSDAISEYVYECFQTYLINILQEVCIRTLIAEMHLYKQQKKLHGQDEREEYEFFHSEIVGTSGFKKELFEKYPILWRCIEEKIYQAVGYYSEIVENFVDNKSEIQNELCKGNSVKRITNIKSGLSDVHNQGKSVVVITLDDSLDLLYKPRSMENELGFLNLLEWISDKVGLDCYKYSILSYDNHSWCSIVKHDSCDTEEQVKRYYQRFGIQLVLVYCLGTRDLHFENVIASGEYPVLVDLEALTYGKREHNTDGIKDAINQHLADSVLCSGLLPYAWQNLNIDSSGISGKGGQKYGFKVPVIVNRRTANMRIEYRYPETKAVQNLVKVKEKDCNPVQHVQDLLDGFKKAYVKILENKEELLQRSLFLQNLNSRYVTMNTQQYSMLLSASYHPSVMRDGAERETLFYSLWKGRNETEQDVLDSEIQDLLNGNIPYFSCSVCGKYLIHDGKEIDNKHFSKTAWEVFIEKIKKMSVSDMNVQKEYIRMSIELFSGNRCNYENHVYSMDDKKWKERRNQLEKITIKQLENRILRHAIWNQEKTQVNWLTTQLSDKNGESWRLLPMNHYLYSGLAGMLLLFYELKTAKRPQAMKVYDTLKNEMFTYTENGRCSFKNLDSSKTGLYEGEGSIVYAYLCLYKRSSEQIYLRYAEKHSEIVRKLLKQDQRYDLLSGNAGAAWSFLLLYGSTGNAMFLQAGEEAIQILLKSAEEQVQGIGWRIQKEIPPMSGLAHGNSGILIPILALSKYTGRTMYEEIADKIWNYENSLYDPAINNWKDTREQGKVVSSNPIGSVAWCHGAAGVLYSRILCYEFVEDKKWKNRLKLDIKRAYKKLKEYWKRDSDSLCHGNCGNLLILKIAQEKMKEYGISVEIEWDVELLKGELEKEIVHLLPQEQINFGFMNGYGGILYQCWQDISVPGSHIE